MAKKIKKTAVKKIRMPKKILEFYYLTPNETDAKELSQCISAVDSEQVEVWTQLNLMEVVLTYDSLIFEEAKECFIDPLDLAFLDKYQIKSMYQISFDALDIEKVKEVLEEILMKMDGFIASDTEDFLPIYQKENINSLG